MDTVKRAEVVSSHRTHDKDTGSPEVQVALLTARILELTEHLKSHKKDFATRRGLLKLVGRRTSMMRYLRKKNWQRYEELRQKLGLRK